MHTTAKYIKSELKKLGSPEKAKISSWFFKTGKGQYGYGDVFWGITVPEQRALVKRCNDISLDEIQILINDKVHECRLAALLLLVSKYNQAAKGAVQNLNTNSSAPIGTNKHVNNGTNKEVETIVKFYIKNLSSVNNWDLVDTSAPNILGDYILKHNFRNGDMRLLNKYAVSKDIWIKRVAIVSTYAFIKAGKFEPTIAISKMLLRDTHDLIHKATGWMLREMGKMNLQVLRGFLDAHSHEMPRTMLRYAIEKMTEQERKKYMSKKGIKVC